MNPERFPFKNTLFTPTQIQKAFDSLLMLKVIKPIGTVDGEIRYTLTDESLKDLVVDCWQVHNWIIQKMNLKWMYETKKPVRRKEEKQKRDWLELSYDLNQANKVIIDHYTFRSDLDVIKATQGTHCVSEDKKKIKTALVGDSSVISSLLRYYSTTSVEDSVKSAKRDKEIFDQIAKICLQKVKEKHSNTIQKSLLPFRTFNGNDLSKIPARTFRF